MRYSLVFNLIEIEIYFAWSFVTKQPALTVRAHTYVLRMYYYRTSVFFNLLIIWHFWEEFNSNWDQLCPFAIVACLSWPDSHYNRILTIRSILKFHATVFSLLGTTLAPGVPAVCWLMARLWWLSPTLNPTTRTTTTTGPATTPSNRRTSGSKPSLSKQSTTIRHSTTGRWVAEMYQVLKYSQRPV